MLQIIRLSLIFLMLFLNGCCGSTGTCGGPIATGPAPKPSPEARYFSLEDCEGPSNCKCHQCNCGGKEPRCCPRPCGHNGLLQQLACQGVQVIELGNRVTIILYADNNFDINSADLTEESHAALDNIVELIESYGPISIPIQVTGYVDDVGYRFFKCDLSLHMADAVVGYLWSHGIPLEKFAVRGGGYCDPIASVHTPCGNAYNRRVEINLWRCCANYTRYCYVERKPRRGIFIH